MPQWVEFGRNELRPYIPPFIHRRGAIHRARLSQPVLNPINYSIADIVGRNELRPYIPPFIDRRGAIHRARIIGTNERR